MEHGTCASLYSNGYSVAAARRTKIPPRNLPSPFSTTRLFLEPGLQNQDSTMAVHLAFFVQIDTHQVLADPTQSKLRFLQRGTLEKGFLLNDLNLSGRLSCCSCEQCAELSITSVWKKSTLLAARTGCLLCFQQAAVRQTSVQTCRTSPFLAQEVRGTVEHL